MCVRYHVEVNVNLEVEAVKDNQIMWEWKQGAKAPPPLPGVLGVAATLGCQLRLRDGNDEAKVQKVTF